MKLHWSPRSPFVRKVMIVLHELSMVDQVECVRTVVSSTSAPNAEILSDNPLAQIPTLLLDDGTALFDSRVICEYLDSIAKSPKLFPQSGAARFEQLRWLCLGDGLTGILLVLRNERLRTNGGDINIRLALEEKIRACFQTLNREAKQLGDAKFGIGHIAIACAIAQFDFRFPGNNWADKLPDLARWYAQIAARPSLIATAVVDDSDPVENAAFVAAPVEL